MKVDVFKSDLVGVRVDIDHLHHLADLLGCNVGHLLTSYLGLPLCLGIAYKFVWARLIE